MKTLNIRSSFSKSQVAFNAALSAFSLLFVLTIVRDRSLVTLAKHFAKGDAVFILKNVFLFLLIFFAFTICDAFYKAFFKEKILRFRIKNAAFFFAVSLFFVSAFLYFFSKWCKKTFPISEVKTVIFVLASPLEGALKPFFKNLAINALVPALAFFLLLASVIFFKIKSLQKKHSKENFKTNVFFSSLAIFAFSFAYFFFSFHLLEYPSVLRDFKKPAEFSFFWEENFFYDEIEFPQKKRNLIFVFLESIEKSFGSKSEGGIFSESLIPNLSRLAKENVSFGGGVDCAGTGWTVAAMTGKLAGIPQNIAAEANPTGLPVFLPGAIFLSDILKSEGYEQVFLCGSDKGFASRDRLMESHGVQVKDLFFYRENGFLPKNYHNGFWGFEDFYLYDFAKKELETLSKSEKPFALYFLTVDTHAPEGFICEKCENAQFEKSENLSETDSAKKYECAIKCADRQIADFVAWCKMQKWFLDTTIVIVGDHLSMSQNPLLFKDELRSSRRWIDIFINSAAKPKSDAQCERLFCSFDIFPTTLASLGAAFKNSGGGGSTCLWKKFVFGRKNARRKIRTGFFERGTF